MCIIIMCNIELINKYFYAKQGINNKASKKSCLILESDKYQTNQLSNHHTIS